jgi:hypothetical protein
MRTWWIFEPDNSKNRTLKSHLVAVWYKAFQNKHAFTYPKDKDFACRPINVKFAVGRIISIDALTREKVYDVLWSVFVTICCCHLQSQIHSITEFLLEHINHWNNVQYSY